MLITASYLLRQQTVSVLTVLLPNSSSLNCTTLNHVLHESSCFVWIFTCSDTHVCLRIPVGYYTVRVRHIHARHASLDGELGDMYSAEQHKYVGRRYCRPVNFKKTRCVCMIIKNAVYFHS
jgi:hypothetical protein